MSNEHKDRLDSNPRECPQPSTPQAKMMREFELRIDREGLLYILAAAIEANAGEEVFAYTLYTPDQPEVVNTWTIKILERSQGARFVMREHPAAE
jgi:hypothetical protein